MEPNSAQPSAHQLVHLPSQTPHPGVSVPLPGTPGYVALQMQVMKNTLSRAPEPTDESRHGVLSQELLTQWTEEIKNGELQIRGLGVQVPASVIHRTVYFKFLKLWMYWRSFRLHDLPPEIIANIFRLVVWSTGNPAEGVRQRLWLTWVCRLWRELAIGDATLWNAIWFRDPPPYERSFAWFERAGSAPIDIRLDERNPMWEQNEDQHVFTAEQMSNLLDRLFVKLAQIRMLVVIVDNWPPAITVLRKLQAAGNAGTPISIERLEIYRMGKPYVWVGPGFDSDGHHDPPVLNGGQTQKLNHLCLAGVHIDWSETPLRNLTTLDLRSMPMNVAPSLERFRAILRECPTLNRLALDGSGPRPTEKPFDHVPVDLLHLKTLVLGSFNLPYACFIVSQINAPHLLDLTLMALTGTDYIPLIKLLTPKFTEVRLLTLYGVQVEMTPLGKVAMARWFLSMPDLAYARIAQLKTNVLKLLLDDPGKYRQVDHAEDYPTDEVFCPDLKTLEVQAMPYATIVDFCRRRKEMGLPITKIYLNPPWAHTLSVQAVRELRSVAAVYVAPVGTNTTEENELLRREVEDDDDEEEEEEEED
ncbi:hypothetical protein EDD16DRAFT_1574551 [Pisolithus croceorrhizus]|nr:hypothetical protein EDD16DRAFT_1574551 [Pisolithus croceorrhizus]KAI6136344.1 hypothetical protein F5141DRAFT_1019561 [Pisolithus sp. B1]